MAATRALVCGTLLLSLFLLQKAIGQSPQAPASTPTFRVTSNLVFLDATVVDKKGHPVTQGLTKDDFLITEDKKPQRIFSFEPPENHLTDAGTAGEPPVTIFVLDLLNSTFNDFAYIRHSVRKYLDEQPEQLASPCELMVLRDRSLQMMQGYTRSKADLLAALEDVQTEVPYKKMNFAFDGERFGQSLDALQQIALQNRGISGRKNIVWVGHGSPSLFSGNFAAPALGKIDQYVHDTTNMLVEARISLFLIYPGLSTTGPMLSISGQSAETRIGDDDPFSGDINFGVFVNETGGTLFSDRNDIDHEIVQSEQLGSAYYTLTYRSPDGPADGKFRRIRVTMRDPDLRVITKAGYFAPDPKDAFDPRQRMMVDLAEAAQSTIPYQGLTMTIKDLVWRPDTQTAQFTVLLRSGNLLWQPAQDGTSTTDVKFAAASLNGRRDILASKVETLTVMYASQDPTRLAKTLTQLPMTIRVSLKAQDVRLVIQSAEDGRLGTVDLDRKTLEAAPRERTPDPQLAHRVPQDKSTASPPKP